MNVDQLLLDVTQRIDIEASNAKVFESLIRRLSTENSSPDNSPMPMVLEERPGGRWFRDLGDENGHWWGTVQVIKPPTLLEIHCPLFMSYAAAGHVQFRLTEENGSTALTIRHRVVGMIETAHREGLNHGWSHLMNGVKGDAEA